MKWATSLKYTFFLIFFIQIIVLLINGSGTYADALRGYEAMRQFEAGGELNVLSYPIVNGEFNFFLSWWSPGQWMVPYFIQILGIENIQYIQAILILLCTSTGLFGFYKLFKCVAFSDQIIWGSLIAIVTNQLFYWHFFLYYGGDLLVFAFLPYFVLFVLKIAKNVSIKNTFFFIILALVGCFLKNSWLIITFAALIYIGANYFKQILSKTTLLLGVSGVIVYGVVYFLILQHGETPGSSVRTGEYMGLTHDVFGDIFYAIGSPFGIFSRISPLIQKAGIHSSLNLNLLGIIPFLGSLYLFYILFKRLSNPYYKFLFYFGSVFLLVMTLLYFLDKAVSYEMRHFAPIGFLFFPVIFQWIVESRFIKFFITIVALICLLDLALFAVQIKRIESSHSFVGEYKMLNHEVELINLVKEWDENTENGILISEEVWFPVHFVKHNAKISLNSTSDDRWGVNSGMELTKKAFVRLDKIGENQDNMLLVVTTNNLMGLEHNEKSKIIYQNKSFTIISYIREE